MLYAARKKAGLTLSAHGPGARATLVVGAAMPGNPSYYRVDGLGSPSYCRVVYSGRASG